MNKNTTITKIEELETGKFYVAEGHHYAMRFEGEDHKGCFWFKKIGGTCSEARHYLPVIPATQDQIADWKKSQESREETLSAYYAEKARTGGYSGD
jgi:hypothetical protein